MRILIAAALVAPLLVAGPAGAKPKAAKAWDFNGDGIADLAFGVPIWHLPDDTNRPYRGAIGVAYGSRAGLSPTPGLVLGPPSVNTGGLYQGFGRVLTSGDYNADGYADLAVGGVDDPAGRGGVSLFFGAKGGLSTKPVPLAKPGKGARKFGFALATGDVNRDGYPDLFAAEVYGGRAWVFRGGPGFRTRRTATRIAVWDKKSYVRSAASGDFNGDGYGDIALSWYRRKDINTKTPDRLSLFGGSGKGLKRPVTAKVPAGRGVLAIGDLTGDRRAEIALPTRGGLRVWLGTAKGFGRRPLTVHGEAGAVSIGGGRLAVAEPAAGVVTTWRLLPAGALVDRRLHLPPGAPTTGYGTSVALRDFDGDGRPDVAAGLPYYGYELQGTPDQRLRRAVAVDYAGALPDRLFQLEPLSGGSLNEIVLP